jgi:hypothetical protein
MVSEGTLALLSACAFQLKEQRLAIARDQIRMTIGCLKALGKFWPRTARNVRELQTIALHVLNLEPRKAASTRTTRSSVVPSLSSGPGHTNQTSETEQEALDYHNEAFPTIESIEDLCGWETVGSLELDFSWGSNM